jgi:hypothetical protein
VWSARPARVSGVSIPPMTAAAASGCWGHGGGATDGLRADARVGRAGGDVALSWSTTLA